MIIFYLGANIHQEALDMIEQDENAVIVYNDESEDISSFRSSINRLDAVGRSFCINRSKIKSSKQEFSIFNLDEQEQIVSHVLNDFTLFLMQTRENRFDFRGAFHNLCYFSDVIYYALKFIEKYKPQLVFCSYTPHELQSWIFFRTLEEAGIRIIRLISSPLPWILLPIVGLSNGHISKVTQNLRVDSSKKVSLYLSRLRGSYEHAIPYYERVFSRLPSWRYLTIGMLSWPRHIMQYIEKLLVLYEYRSSIIPLADETPYAVYFLHYQPEMNTLPEAGLYCDQFQAIKKLADAMPKGIKLLVKEHPSTFSKRCDRRWRPQGFYDRIANLPNTQICPPGLTSFQLIDKSIFVASIAGVCLTEALARGVPAVTFSSTRFSFFTGDLIIDASSLILSDLKGALERLITNGSKLSQENLTSCMNMVATLGYDGSDDEDFIPSSLEQAAGISRKANRIAVYDIINGNLS